MSTPYTYLIGWPENNIWYYGVRYSKNAHPDDLWEKYFTSSKHVRNYVKVHGQPSVIEIRRVFSTAEQARVWESKVLRRLDAVRSEKFLNKSYSDGSFVASKEHLSNLAKMHTGRRLSDEHRAKLSAAGRGRAKSEAHKQNIASALRGKTRPESVRSKISSTRKHRNIKSSTEHMNSQKFHCSTCDKVMTKGNFVRWHQH